MKITSIRFASGLFDAERRLNLARLFKAGDPCV